MNLGVYLVIILVGVGLPVVDSQPQYIETRVDLIFTSEGWFFYKQGSPLEPIFHNCISKAQEEIVFPKKKKKKAQEEMIELFFLFLFVLWMGGLGDVRLCSMVSRYDRDMPLIWQGHVTFFEVSRFQIWRWVTSHSLDQQMEYHLQYLKFNLMS